MKLTGGEIYFLGEKDLKTGKDTNLVKIGLVREKESRDTWSRLLEHQTGNPRMLHVVEIVKTPVVERVETALLGIFATRRVSGEWFYFNDIPVTDAINEAKNLSRSANKQFKDLEKAEELKSKKSSSKVVSSNDSINKLHMEYLKLNFQIKQCKETVKFIQDILMQALKNGLEVQHIIDVQKRKQTQLFDEDAFKAKYPKLWTQFSVSTEEMNQRFTWVGVKTANFELLKLNPELAMSLSKFESVGRNATVHISAAEKLHFLYLSILTHQAPLDWRKEFVEAKMKSACGTSSGIEGICNWNRVIEKESKIDKELLREKQPKKYEEFVRLSKVSEAIILSKDLRYHI